MDICKWIYKYLCFGLKVKFVVILIILGIGLEVILFVVIIDKNLGNIKYLLVDYEFILDVVIVDFEFVYLLLKIVVVDIGMDVLIYVIEVYVLVMVNDYMDGLVIKVI